MKSKILLISAIYTVVAWIVALLVRFNTGASDTYSTIIFGVYLAVVFGIYAMYLAVVISSIVAIAKSGKTNADKTVTKSCIINAIISLALISTVFITYLIIDFHF